MRSARVPGILLILPLGVLTTLSLSIAISLTMPFPIRERVVCVANRWEGWWWFSEAHRLGIREVTWQQIPEERFAQPLKKMFQLQNVPLADTPPRSLTLDSPAPPQPASVATTGDWIEGVDLEFGWPRPALTCQLVSAGSGPGKTCGADVRGGIHVSGLPPNASMRDFRIIPLRPFWPGLILDSFLFAAIWWLILSGLAATRRAIRRRRGQCPRCAYDLHATPPGTPCPECGAVVAPPRLACGT